MIGSREKLSFALAYLRAALLVFIVLAGFNHVAHLVSGHNLPWLALIPIAALWPAVMTAIT